jgi:class 3 adenylate cyclase/tetratricopeptide (TPR) repeat protein
MRYCGACGAPLSTGSPDGAADNAQRRHMTAMFCDVVDSTSLAERLDPEDFRELLRAYQRGCVSAIERYGGFVARYLGDGVLAYFGYPQAHEHDPTRAVHAALGILDEVAELNGGRMPENLGVAVKVRIGVHTGIVVAGEMGAGQTRERLEIVGETPHIAARLQTIAQPGWAVLSDATSDLLADRFELESLGPTSLKGISRPIGAHRVLRALGSSGATPGAAPPTRKPMVGRTDERARLWQAWERANTGHGELIHVCGEAGIGKTRLVQALREDAAGLSTERILQCSPHHSSTALDPVIRFLEQLTSVDRSRAPEDQLDTLEHFVRRAGLREHDAVPLLADLLSIPIGAGSTTLMPRDARNALLGLLKDLLVGDAVRRPLLLIVEDVHWADPTTCELLERIIADLDRVPVLCVLTFRSESEPPWTQWHQVAVIEVGPLAHDEVRALAVARSPDRLDADTLQRVESTADGVPLFVEEMVKMLRSQEGSDMRGAQSDGAVPPTLHSLLAERLDRLPQLTEVIDVAAVLGREFERGLLEQLTRSGGPPIRSAVAQLVGEEVLRPVEGSRSRLEFRHVLLQEAAYGRLLRRRRRELHGRVAELLATRISSAGEAAPEVVAHHFSQGYLPALAIPFWRRAGTRALERAAFQEAAEHFRRGVEALDAARPAPDGDVERGDLLTRGAAALQAAHGYAADGVDRAYASARAAWDRTGLDDRRVPVIRGQWMFHLLRSEYPAALALADEMVALGDRGGDRVCLAEGHLFLGLSHMYLSNLDLARTHLEQAHVHYRRPLARDEIYEAQGDTGVGALSYLALVLWNQGALQDAATTSESSLELADAIGGPVTLAQAWGMRSGLLMTMGELKELGPWLEKTRAHSAERNIGYWRTVCSLWSGWLQGRSGDLERGVELVKEQLEAYCDAGARLALPHLQVLLADLYLTAGDRRQALDALYRGQEHIDATDERFSEPELHWVLGGALMSGDAPDPDAATIAFERAVASARAQNAKLLELRAVTYLVMHRRVLGETATALASLQAVCDWFGSDCLAPDVVRARTLLATGATVA